MKLLTTSIREQLLRNGRIAQALAEDGRAEAEFRVLPAAVRESRSSGHYAAW